MMDSHVDHMVCPACHSGLVVASVGDRAPGAIKTGTLMCRTGQHQFQIREFIPRFVLTDANTSAFGFEWNKHPRTQFDSVNGMHLSEDRFYRQTNWSRDLSGQRILEIGSGAGRFTEIALQTGAQVFSVDASRAVDANWANNGRHQNLFLCQASLCNLPFPHAYFDKVFCFGVLQHTPDPALALETIAMYAKPGGELVVDAYNRKYWRTYHSPMYLVRPITRRIPHDRLYRWVSWWVPRLLPTSTWIRDNIPMVGRQVSAVIPIANYNGVFPTQSASLLEQYAILDTFDTLAPRYIQPQSPHAMRQYFEAAGYEVLESDDATVFAMRGRRKSS